MENGNGIEKYGLVLCNMENDQSVLPQFLNYKEQNDQKEHIFDLQCKKGYLLDKNNNYNVTKPLCTLMGYNSLRECPKYMWHYYEKIAYICKLYKIVPYSGEIHSKC